MPSPSVMAATKTYRLLSAAATTNATSVKATNGTVCRVRLRNAKAASIYLKFYDKSTVPTVGTDTPRKTVHIPASSDFDTGLIEDYYSQGIAFAITGAAADADTTALVAADVVCLNIDYR